MENNNVKMTIENTLQTLEVFWPVFLAVISAFFYKFIPYIRTKVFKNQFYNVELAFFLLEYELLGIIVGNTSAIVLAIVFGSSTWEKMFIKEFLIAEAIVTIIYVLGIVIIVNLKTERGKCGYVRNIIMGLIFYGSLFIQFWLMLMDEYKEEFDMFFYSIVVGIFLLQIVSNFKNEQVKKVEYIVVTKEKMYDTPYEPVKRGKYYFVRIVDEKKNEIKRVQLPEEKIERIEYIVEKIDEENQKEVQKGPLNMNIDKIEKWIDKQKVSFISSVDENGYPNIKAMLKPRKRNGLKEFYFSTNTSSLRVKHFLSNSNASIYFYYKGLIKYKGVMLIGNVEVLTNQEIKNEIWKRGDTVFYKKGVIDPDYCVLKFTAKTGRYYCDMKTESFDI